MGWRERHLLIINMIYYRVKGSFRAGPTPNPDHPGHGPREQKALPIVEVVHPLDEPDQECPSCGGALEPMADQFEEADEIDVVERSFRVVRHKRQKYRCRCGAPPSGTVVVTRSCPDSR